MRGEASCSRRTALAEDLIFSVFLRKIVIDVHYVTVRRASIIKLIQMPRCVPISEVSICLYRGCISRRIQVFEGELAI